MKNKKGEISTDKEAAKRAARKLRERQMETMTPEQRRDRARKAAQARWKKKKAAPLPETPDDKSFAVGDGG